MDGGDLSIGMYQNKSMQNKMLRYTVAFIVDVLRKLGEKRKLRESMSFFLIFNTLAKTILNIGTFDVLMCV